MIAMNEPDYWVVIEIKPKNQPVVYKLFSTWAGGYTSGDTWKLNSGIAKISKSKNCYYITGYSDTVYRVHKESYRCSIYSHQVLRRIIEDLSSSGKADVRVLEEKTDWAELLQSNEAKI
jgi:hypothetical protein